MQNKRFRYRPKGSMHYRWTTKRVFSNKGQQKTQNKETYNALRQMSSVGKIALKMLLFEGKKPKVSGKPEIIRKRDYYGEQRKLENEMSIPEYGRIGGSTLNILDRKIIDSFPNKVVRKDLTSHMKKGANVPTYVLEYLLGMYCTTEDEEEVKIGLDKIKKILSENYVRPDQSEYVKSKIKENGQYTIIDKITVEVDEKEDKYVARFTNLDLLPFEVNAPAYTISSADIKAIGYLK